MTRTTLAVRSPGDPARQPLERALPALHEAAVVLRALGTTGRAEAVARAGAAWARAAQPPVCDWLAAGAPASGYSAPMLHWGCAEAFSRWTRAELLGLVADELGQPEVPVARMPTVTLLVLAATVPPAGLQSVMLALLAGSAVLVRPARRLAPLVEAFLGSLASLAPELAAAVRLAEVEPQDLAGIAALAQAADAVVVHGSDAAVAAWHAAARPQARRVGYGHRLSAAALGRAALEPEPLAKILDGLALDLCAWDQSGCLSPHVLYVEQGGATSPLALAHRLAGEALPALEARLPPGPRSLVETAARELFVRSHLVEADRVDAPGGATLLVHDTPGDLEPGPGHRVLVVRPFADLDALVGHLAAVAPRLQSVGGSGFEVGALQQRLAPAGLNYLCAPGEMQRPPLRWRHDGIGSLAPLLG